MGLLFNGFLKVPMQFFILLVGVMVFVFYQFNDAPLNFNPAAKQTVIGTSYEKEYCSLEDKLSNIQTEKTNLLNEQLAKNDSGFNNQEAKLYLQKLNNDELEIRESAKNLIKKASSCLLYTSPSPRDS